MTVASCSLVAFALLNFARVIAYVPQIIRIRRDPHGAAAVSIMTWVLFTGANLTTVTYAVAGGGSADYLIAIVFSLNALGCGSIASLTAWKRVSFKREKSQIDHSAARGDCSPPVLLFNDRRTIRKAA